MAGIALTSPVSFGLGEHMKCYSALFAIADANEIIDKGYRLVTGLTLTSAIHFVSITTTPTAIADGSFTFSLVRQREYSDQSDDEEILYSFQPVTFTKGAAGTEWDSITTWTYLSGMPLALLFDHKEKGSTYDLVVRGGGTAVVGKHVVFNVYISNCGCISNAAIDEIVKTYPTS